MNQRPSIKNYLGTTLMLAGAIAVPIVIMAWRNNVGWPALASGIAALISIGLGFWLAQDKTGTPIKKQTFFYITIFTIAAGGALVGATLDRFENTGELGKKGLINIALSIMLIFSGAQTIKKSTHLKKMKEKKIMNNQTISPKKLFIFVAAILLFIICMAFGLRYLEMHVAFFGKLPNLLKLAIAAASAIIFYQAIEPQEGYAQKQQIVILFALFILGLIQLAQLYPLPSVLTAASYHRIMTAALLFHMIISNTYRFYIRKN